MREPRDRALMSCEAAVNACAYLEFMDIFFIVFTLCFH